MTNTETVTEVREKPPTSATEVTRDWVTGWALSREAQAPVEIPGGFRIEVGRPGQIRRYVLSWADPAEIRKITEEVTTPGIWLKVFAPEEVVLPLLPPTWTAMDPGTMMTTVLRQARVDPPTGYTIHTSTTAGVIVAQVLAADGELAARGRAGVAGQSATFDQIVTEEAHRRRGLGGIIMSTLGNLALTQGAKRGVLGASDDGRALYLTLGWTQHSMLTGAAIPEPADATGPAGA